MKEESYEPWLKACKEWFRPYQLAWIKDESRFRVAVKARQIGWSTTIAWEAVVGAGLLGKDQILISSSEKTAGEVLAKCYKWVSLLNSTGHSVKLEKKTQLEIQVRGGGKIICLAQNPATIGGYTGDCYMDEAAFHAMDREIYSQLVPIATIGYRVSICSRPLGQSGLFYDIWSNEGQFSSYSRHSVDVFQAEADGLPVDIPVLKGSMSDDDFASNYLCKFVDESTAFFPYELIRPCIGERVEGVGPRYIGVDIGRKHDKTVIYVVRELGGKLFTESVDILEKETFEVQRHAIRERADGCTSGQIDCMGIGSQLAEEIEKEFPQIHGSTMQSEDKERMAVSVKRRLEAKTLQIPDDRLLISDIHSIRKSVTPGNKIKFDALRTSEGHADRFWALALAVDAATTEVAPRITFI